MKEQRAKRRSEKILARSWPPARGRRLVVLCYHSVHPSKGFASAAPDLFEQHVEWLLEHCDVVPFSSIQGLLTTGTDGRPIVAITFDDGYEDNHTYAMPILLAHNLPATIFLTTGLVERDPKVVGRFSKLWGVSEDEVRGLSWSQVSEMREAGFEIGAHTRSHPKLSAIGASQASEEIGDSKRSIEDHLGEPVRLFAYPFGKPQEHLSEETIDIVARSGFASAATVSYRGARPADNPLSIPRFPITKDPLSVLAGKVRGRLDIVALWQESVPLWVTRLFSTDPAQAADGG
jgi:peptidoglycan/xylan/chitin deacetylase (PgdA/CDA1 family)